MLEPIPSLSEFIADVGVKHINKHTNKYSDHTQDGIARDSNGKNLT